MSNFTGWVPSLWKDMFSEMLNEENALDCEEDWTLNFNYNILDTLTDQERRRGWKVFCHCAHARFQCSLCNKIWSSARVSVLFHYRLWRGRGTVIVRPLRQTCRCRANSYELPDVSDEEVRKALLKLFYKIKKNCYRVVDDDDDCDCDQRDRPILSKPHESSMCEACALGICCKDEQDED